MTAAVEIYVSNTGAGTSIQYHHMYVVVKVDGIDICNDKIGIDKDVDYRQQHSLKLDLNILTTTIIPLVSNLMSICIVPIDPIFNVAMRVLFDWI